MQTDGDTPRQAMGICLMTPDSDENSLNPHVLVNIYADAAKTFDCLPRSSNPHSGVINKNVLRAAALCNQAAQY